jgi:hypothetical protein
VLALLTGSAATVRDVLGEWPDLVQTFARAELLLAAADDLTQQATSCGQRLAKLADEWSAEAIYFYLLACHHLAGRRFQDVAGVLGRWPAAGGTESDLRPLYLEGLVAVSQGRSPTIPAGLEPAEQATQTGISAAAWAFLGAQAEALQGAHARCWESCQQLVRRGLATERLLQLQTRAAVVATADIEPDWQPAPVVPDSCLPAAAHYAVNCDEPERAKALVAVQREVHPENLLGFWLDAAFWLDPVRNWIA